LDVVRRMKFRRSVGREPALCALSALLIGTGACETLSEAPSDDAFGSGAGVSTGAAFPTSTGGSTSGGIIFGGSSSFAGGTISISPGGSLPNCGGTSAASTDIPVFTYQMVRNQAPAARVLYSWTTEEQVAELRETEVLLSMSESSDGSGKGFAFEVIQGVANATDAPGSSIAQDILTRFDKVRYAWPHPWATRLGWPGESYGNQLLRIVLKPESWIARVSYYGVSVFDLDNQEVPLDQAELTPERIGAVYFIKDESAGGPSCGTFLGGSNGYREFILGNPEMIEEWSVSTEEIRERIESDIELLGLFLERTRACPPTIAGDFNASVVCAWNPPFFGDEVSVYLQALSQPSDLYVPHAAELAGLIQTLENDLFEPNPLVVTSE
jgi:hypothetical protein